MATCNGNVSHLPVMTAVSVGSGLSKSQLNPLHETQDNPTVKSLEVKGLQVFPFPFPASPSLPFPVSFPCAVPHVVIFLLACCHCRHPATVFKVLPC